MRDETHLQPSPSPLINSFPVMPSLVPEPALANQSAMSARIGRGMRSLTRRSSIHLASSSLFHSLASEGRTESTLCCEAAVEPMLGRVPLRLRGEGR